MTTTLLRAARERITAGAEVLAVHIVAREELEPARAAMIAQDPEQPELERSLVDETREGYREAFAAWRAELARRMARGGRVVLRGARGRGAPIMRCAELRRRRRSCPDRCGAHDLPRAVGAVGGRRGERRRDRAPHPREQESARDAAADGALHSRPAAARDRARAATVGCAATGVARGGGDAGGARLCAAGVDGCEAGGGARSDGGPKRLRSRVHGGCGFGCSVLRRSGDVLIAFDSAAHWLRGDDASASLAAKVSASPPQGSLSAALAAGMRAASQLRGDADSVELVVISPFALG